ncbi:MAG: CoA transferase, partial [Alphaproteobacteria bacterium]|nr:CoA transferase [Alphaproteobacteria bacterium]
MLKSWLSGVRVLDLGQYLPGPAAAQMLADMGADVLKVESPAGDPLRGLDPATGKDVAGVSPYYAAVNAGKRVASLDLKSAEGKGAFERLIAAADVLIESFRPGRLAKIGLGPDRLRALNARLVHVALSGYGQTGPLRDAAGHDLNYLAMTGALAASGPETAPAIAWPPVADHAAAMQAALCVLGALMGRAKTGKGAFVDASLAETVLSWQAWGLTAAAGPGVAREGAVLNGGAAYYRVYRAKDGKFISLGAIEPVFWRNFCRAVGRADWIGRQAESLPQTALTAEVAALVATATGDEWTKRLENADCCYHPVLDYAEVASAPHVAARGLVRRARAAGSSPAH